MKIASNPNPARLSFLSSIENPIGPTRMQPCPCAGTGSCNVSGVLWYLRLKQYNVEPWIFFTQLHFLLSKIACNTTLSSTACYIFCNSCYILYINQSDLICQSKRPDCRRAIFVPMHSQTFFFVAIDFCLWKQYAVIIRKGIEHIIDFCIKI